MEKSPCLVGWPRTIPKEEISSEFVRFTLWLLLFSCFGVFQGHSPIICQQRYSFFFQLCDFLWSSLPKCFATAGCLLSTTFLSSCILECFVRISYWFLLEGILGAGEGCRESNSWQRTCEAGACADELNPQPGRYFLTWCRWKNYFTIKKYIITVH